MEPSRILLFVACLSAVDSISQGPVNKKLCRIFCGGKEKARGFVGQTELNNIEPRIFCWLCTKVTKTSTPETTTMTTTTTTTTTTTAATTTTTPEGSVTMMTRPEPSSSMRTTPQTTTETTTSTTEDSLTSLPTSRKAF